MVIRHINPRTVRVSFSDGSYVDAAVHRISLLPGDSDSSSDGGGWPTTGSGAARGLGVSVPCLSAPRSQLDQARSPVVSGGSASSEADSSPDASEALPRRSTRLRRPPLRLGIDEPLG